MAPLLKAAHEVHGTLSLSLDFGALSSLSVPLPITEGIAGAINVYARKPHAFDEDSRSVATRFAAYAAVVGVHPPPRRAQNHPAGR